MTDAWVPGFILTLLFGLQYVSANEVMKCTTAISCPKGFRCCDRGCCPEKNIWDSSNRPFMILFVIFAVMLPLLCICMARYFCRECRPQQILRENHQAPPEPPSSARIWITDLDPPPPYSQVVPKSTPTEPPPPYSLVGQVRNATI